MTKVIMEGWMHRYGRRRIGRSFFHKRYFVLDASGLAYYKRKPSENSRQQVALNSLVIDGNCRVEDRGLETHHGHSVYVLWVYNNRQRENRVTMAANSNQEFTAWKDALERVVEEINSGGTRTGLDSHPKIPFDVERTASSSDRESLGTAQEDDDEKNGKSKGLLRNLTYGNGVPESVNDWSAVADTRNSEIAEVTRNHWRLVRCQNGLRFFEEIPEIVPMTRYKAMKAVGVVEASCADIFELVMGMDETRYEWDPSFHHGSLVEEVDGHTAVFYHRLELDWLPMLIWPRDLCYSRYWRRNDDGSYVILFRSKVHPNCPEQPGCVRAHIESGGYTISPLKTRSGGEPRAKVQQLVQIDLKGWGVGVVPFYHQHTVIQMLNSVSGLREWFAEDQVPPPSQKVVQMNSETAESRKEKGSTASLHATSSMDPLIFEESDDDDDLVAPNLSDESRSGLFANFEQYSHYSHRKERYAIARPGEEEPTEPLDISMFSGTLAHSDVHNGRNSWSIPAGHLFRVRSKRFLLDRSKCPAGEPLMQLVTVDWFKDTKRMDHVSRRKGCAVQIAAEKGLFTLAFNVQVPGSTHYSMVFYFVARKPIPKGSLLHRFVEGDESYRNSRLKLIPSVPKGSWIVRQSVGSTPCILGKAVDCSYYRGSSYLEVDVDIGSSNVANGVLGLVFGVVTSLVVDMAFLVQGNSPDELPEHLIGAVRISHLELSSAVTPSELEF